jgi:superfamily II DNA or RNA helicase
MGCEHIEDFQNEKWDGIIRLFKKDRSFLTGLLRPLCVALKESSHEFRIVDRRNRTFQNFPELEFRKPSWHEDREYQDFTVQKAMDMTRGILNIGTGGGKTMIVAQLIGALKVKPFIFYTLTKDLLYQAKDVLTECLNCDIGQIGDGTVDIKDVNVCTKDAIIYALHKNDKSFDIKNYKFDSCDIWDESGIFGQTDCDKIVNLVKNCRGVFVDEVHHASSVTIQDVMMASENAYWRYGGTATYAREDGEELIIQGLFGKKIVDISLSYLIKHGWLVPATVFFVPITFKNMPYRAYPQIYSHCVINNDEVNQSVAENVKYLESLGKSSLILVSKIAHGKNIAKYLEGALFLTGKDSSKKRNAAIAAMKNGKSKVLIATTLADEGLDIRNLDVVHMVGAGASVTRVPQRIGRVVRKSPGKRYGIAIYYHYCVEYLYQQGLKAKRLISQESRINIKQTCDPKDLKEQLIRFMNENKSLFS